MSQGIVDATKAAINPRESFSSDLISLHIKYMANIVMRPYITEGSLTAISFNPNKSINGIVEYIDNGGRKSPKD